MKFLKHVLPILCIAFVTISISQLLYVNIMQSEEQRCWQELSTTVQDVNKEISIKFTDEISKLHLIETMILHDELFSAEDIAFLHINELQPNTMFSRIDILYPDNTLLSNGQKIEVEENIQFETIQAKGAYLTRRMNDFINGEPCVYYVLPVVKDDTVSAVLIGVIDLKELSTIFKPTIYNGEANICIIDTADGSYVMDSWHDELGNAYTMPERELLPGYEDVDFKNEIKTLQTGSIAFVSQTTGKALYMYYTPLDLFGWETAVFAQEDVLFSNLKALRSKFIMAGFVEVLLLIVYFLWNTYLIKQLTKSNREIEDKTKQLEFLSYHDTLTGLYNRHKYIENLNKLAKGEIWKIGMAYIDLNGLKQLNDSQSHNAGDDYLRSAAQKLAAVFDEHSYRIGGDEFVVLINGVEEAAFADAVDKLCNAMEQEGVSVSVGFLWQEKCEDLEEMLQDAEKKMYIEKQKYYTIHDRRKSSS